ncbi:MAG: T9SS type A sorting domain-containing protein [Bacteroidia bacterium]|nr:T9SS type A sorting domain-containing protein [Bacteroidia bacterium]
MSISVHEATTKVMKKITIILMLLVSIAQAQPNIVKMEYWIGTDPGFGAAIDIPLSNQQPDLSFTQSITPNLNQGINYLGYRSKDVNNVWSHTNFLTLFVVDSTHSVITEVEYFWDIDSGFNTHTDTVYLNPVADITNGLLYANVPLNLGMGTHILFVRSKNSQGRWSHTNYVDSVIVTGTVDIVEFSNQTGVQVYPNPFTENITIEPKDNEKMRVMVYDMEGRKVIDKIINSTTYMDTQKLISGAYLICVLTDNNRVYQSKIIKRD